MVCKTGMTRAATNVEFCEAVMENEYLLWRGGVVGSLNEARRSLECFEALKMFTCEIVRVRSNKWILRRLYPFQ
ncbi:hypothetical protein EYC84_001894 [Monilinia fructicola]|uniref:Uncharacterized protein n=1 Tax=Monilinia fructicola TaxID=38448 RepID=A0A5M9JRQ0_MONFR|nr:hypothetical protein EYC84_001894 [Monilinia fructicola]